MTFPAGGGDAGASTGSAPPPASTPDAGTPVTAPAPADSGGEDKGQAKPATTAPDKSTTAAEQPAQPAPKVEPRSFRDTLESLRTPASGEERPAEEAPAAPKTEAKPPAPKPATEAATAPATAEPPAKPEKQAATPAPAAEEDVEPPNDDEFLKEENLDEALEKRFPEADKGKRGALDFAKRMAARARSLEPIRDMIDGVGGEEGAKLAFEYTNQLRKLAQPAKTLEEAKAQANDFRAFIMKEAPAAYAKLENEVFWNAVDDTPEGTANLQVLLDEYAGDGVVTLDQVKTLVNMFADGKIDLDDLIEQHGDGYTLTKEQRTAKARDEAKKSAYTRELEERLAKVEGKDAETTEAKEEARVGKVRAAMTGFVQKTTNISLPILREYGIVLPDDQNDPKFKPTLRLMRAIQRDLETEMSGDEDFQAVITGINNLQMGGVHSISEGAALNKMKVRLRAILDEYAPAAAEEVKRKNELVAGQVKARTATTIQPAKPRNTPAAPAPSNSERAMESVEESREKRKEAFQRTLEEKRRAAAAEAGAS